MTAFPPDCRLIVVSGPTGIGKTSAAIAIAEHIGGEIVGADSMQIYRHMDIGTAKPTAAEQARIRHHMVDMVDPDQPFDAARYARKGREIVGEICRKGRVPVIAGGTGLYIKALIQGIFPAPAPDPLLRRQLKAQAAANGPEALHRRLAGRDPETAGRIHPHDALRIVRALEVLETTGRPLCEHHRSHGFADVPFRTLKIGMEMDRPRLYERINRRVDAMIDAGFLSEVESLLARGYHGQLKSMQSIGYRHMVAYIDAEISWDEAVRTMKRDTRHYAKRQLTWFKADPDILWTPAGSTQALIDQAEDFLAVE